MRNYTSLVLLYLDAALVLLYSVPTLLMIITDHLFVQFQVFDCKSETWLKQAKINENIVTYNYKCI